MCGSMVREVEQNAGRQSQAAEDIRENRRAGLRRGKADADLAQIGGVGRIVRRKQGIRQRAQRHAVVEEPEAAANHGIPRGETETTRSPRAAKSCSYPSRCVFRNCRS